MPSKRQISGFDHRYNTSEKGKARSKRYDASKKGKAQRAKRSREQYQLDKAARICVKPSCHEPADAGVYCSDHLRYLIEKRKDSNFMGG
jgi:hypothetical protein